MIGRIGTSGHAYDWRLSNFQAVLKWIIGQVHCFDTAGPERVLFIRWAYRRGVNKMFAVSESLNIARYHCGIGLFQKCIVIRVDLSWLCRRLLQVWAKTVLEFLSLIVGIRRWAFLLKGGTAFLIIFHRTFLIIHGRAFLPRYWSFHLLLNYLILDFTIYGLRYDINQAWSDIVLGANTLDYLLNVCLRSYDDWNEPFLISFSIIAEVQLELERVKRVFHWLGKGIKVKNK